MPENTEEVKGSFEKSKKRPQLIKPQIQELSISYMRILIKTAEILTFTNLYVKAVKELKMLQQSKSQMPLITSVPLK